MGMAWLQLQRIITKGGANLISTLPHSTPSSSSRLFSKSPHYAVKVGIPEFLNGIGKGVESHVPKLESDIGDFQKLLVTRTLKLKKLGIPCKHFDLCLVTPGRHWIDLFALLVQSMLNCGLVFSLTLGIEGRGNEELSIPPLQS
ncbi:hypothetical protein LR48_Vigan08g197200 [Vigna angularis]|uniref:Small ribosomal subunit protein mS41 SAM domain-containing protein n=1 Tax=Phaseolus angularis TaxID=3914 RepID=A0A0L9V7U8_PHAAN|nr:hypothetical protein LR48_Vigan08g197200 [Vigna angularis]